MRSVEGTDDVFEVWKPLWVSQNFGRDLIWIRKADISRIEWRGREKVQDSLEVSAP
jgi:hypothetical protein